ncbi:MAG: diguanylate cyclase [Actinobacteria bacterium]|nr:diguanylate cyclase [Actinomycetota bacterium]
MGLVAAAGGNPPVPENEEAKGGLRDRRLRSLEPSDLLAGPAAARPIALAQAYLAVGAAVTGALGALLPHPPYFNTTNILIVDGAALFWGLCMFRYAGRIPFWFLRIAPALATAMTSFAVYFSGDATSGYALFYVWVGLYVFYFPVSRADAAINVLWAFVNYAVVIAIIPSVPPGGDSIAVHHFVITAGTLITAATLLTYLRIRVERLMRRLTDAARTDPLTGLPNRVALHEALERELERARPDARPTSLLLFDLDRFKRVNDRFGVSEGDRIVRRVAALLSESTRIMDVVARSGGEEFAIVLPETDQHRAFLFAEELLDGLRKDFSAPQVKLTASVGIATSPGHADDLAGLMTASDGALQAAKALGRDRAAIYSPEVTSVIGSVTGRRNVEMQAQMATVLSLAEALDQRDSGTARHSQTVGRLCEMMALELVLEEDRVQRLRLAGILHDIGKIAVPDSILMKPGPLTDEEWAQMRRHPELGARILSSRELDDVREWILAHHERPDGTGYPKGLSADEIPLEASIVAVADAFEAMTADRVYRPGMPVEDARQELLSNAGLQFSVDVVHALLRSLEREGAPAIR